MENVNKKGPVEFKILDGKKTDFNLIFADLVYVLNHAIELLKKDPANFILSFAIPVVVGGVLSAILLPMLLGGLLTGGLVGVLISLVVFIFCSIILSLVAYIALLKAIVDVSKGVKFNIIDLFRFGFAHSVNFIVLGVKVLLTIFTGLRNFVNAWLSSIYFVENGGKVSESIKSSQATAQGKTATLVWTVILVGVVTGLVSGILSQVWVSVFAGMSSYLAQLGAFIINGVVTPFAIICQFVLRGELEKHSGHHVAPAHHTPTQHTQA